MAAEVDAPVSLEEYLSFPPRGLLPEGVEVEDPLASRPHLPADFVERRTELYNRLWGDDVEEDLKRQADYLVLGTREATLRRFMQARKFDVEETWTMLQQSLEWRRKENISSIMYRPLSADKLALVRSCLPHATYRTDRDGHPVYIERTGSLDAARLFETLTDEEMMRYHVQLFEYQIAKLLRDMAIETGRVIDTVTVVMDLKGLGMKHLSSATKRMIGLIASTDQLNYPETLKKSLIVNAPFVFSAIWKLIKGFFDERTREKVHILSGRSGLQQLQEDIAPENLPEFLGGTCTDPLSDGESTHEYHAEFDAFCLRLEAGDDPDFSPADKAEVLAAAAEVIPGEAVKEAAEEAAEEAAAAAE